MYLTVNTAFANYLDMFPNLTKSLQFLLITNLKDFINSYVEQKEIFDLQERHETTILNTNKNFFSDNYILDIFVFILTIILLMTTILTVYLLCKHKKIRVLLAGLVLHQVKEVGTTSEETNSECTTLAYIGIILTTLISNNRHVLTLQKIKILQWSQVLKCSKNYDIHFRCTK